ncbi:hypothetical protein KUTeg_012711 [Tegillarca granosa]|uniref:Alpha/beta hydrolase fold-3 domain-containing protein n=1 Tax=Tegillarca granosa TaxID=220873 RepID=A0ABQ9F2S7_TEGGR|nr:hypothetical protein KUTeg_012711 [Tegillarca granosa]
MDILNIYIGTKLNYDHPLNLTRKLLPIVFVAAGENVPEDWGHTREVKFDDVNVRIYYPKTVETDKLYPGMVYYHGGGFILFSIDTYDKVLRRLAMNANIVIVAVEDSLYRLAPEFPFPVPVQDCIKATEYLMENADKFNIDARKIGVAGDSAGGNLAAAVSLHLTNLRPTNTYPIRFQGIIYPMIQSFDFLTPSYQTNADAMPTMMNPGAIIDAWVKYWSGDANYDITPFWTNKHITQQLQKSKYAKYLDYKQLPTKYHITNPNLHNHEENKTLSNEYQKVMLNPLYSPLMADDVSNLPPAFILTAEHDVLRDDGLFYAKRLQDSNVPVNLLHIENGYHAMFSFTRLKIGRKIHRQFQTFIENNIK